MLNSIRKLPPGYLLSAILCWMAGPAIFFFFWLFYPRQDPFPFPDYYLAERYKEKRPSVKINYEIVPANNLSSGSSEMKDGLYYFQYDDSTGIESLVMSDIKTGTAERLAALDANERALKLETDAQRNYIVVWTAFWQPDGSESRLRILNISSGDWLTISDQDGERQWIPLNKLHDRRLFEYELYFSLRGRYFVSKLITGSLHLPMGGFLVFDAQEGDFFSFNALHNTDPYLRPLQDINREENYASFWVPGYYALPPGRESFSRRNILGKDTLRKFNGPGYIKQCFINLQSSELHCSQNRDLPFAPYELQYITEEDLLILSSTSNWRTAEEAAIFTPEGITRIMEISSEEEYFDFDGNVTYFIDLNTLIIDMPAYSIDHVLGGEMVLSLDFTSGLVDRIYFIPVRLYTLDYCLVPSIEAGIFCVPLRIEKESMQGKVLYTECKFYDVASKSEAGTLYLPGHAGASLLVMDEGDYFPRAGEEVYGEGFDIAARHYPAIEQPGDFPLIRLQD